MQHSTFVFDHDSDLHQKSLLGTYQNYVREGTSYKRTEVFSDLVLLKGRVDTAPTFSPM